VKFPPVIVILDDDLKEAIDTEGERRGKKEGLTDLGLVPLLLLEAVEMRNSVSEQ
jgi:hypothetical protein